MQKLINERPKQNGALTLLFFSLSYFPYQRGEAYSSKNGKPGWAKETSTAKRRPVSAPLPKLYSIQG